MNILRNLYRLLNQPQQTKAMTTFYRTKDGLADYHFSIEQEDDGSWRAYILSQPDYRGRPSDCHSTHRLSNDGRHYVCWTKQLRTEHEARQVAAAWADATQRYIRFGQSF